MSNFNIGDVVRIGKGKVEYVVSKIVNEPNELGTYAVEVESMNTGKAQVIEASRLTLLRSADTEPMNVPLSASESVEEASQDAFQAEHADVTEETFIQHEDEDTFDPREDRRQSAYGLSILAAVMRKNPRAGAHNVNPLKSVKGKRAKVRNRVRAQRTFLRERNKSFNALTREAGYTPRAA